MWLHKPVIQDRHLMWKREHYSGFVLVQLRQGACVCMRVCMRVCIAITMGEVTFATRSSSLTIYR